MHDAYTYYDTTTTTTTTTLIGLRHSLTYKSFINNNNSFIHAVV